MENPKNPKISLFASSIRPNLYPELFESLKDNDVEIEVVFAGPCAAHNIPNYSTDKLRFEYIQTGDIKPAQCYEVARRSCNGELVAWMADDCIYSPHLLDKVYNFWMKIGNPLGVISVKTNENDSHNDLNDHRFYGFNVNTPLMAPLGFMSGVILDQLGGIDRRYICGQYENDIVMRVYESGGQVYKFEDGCVDIAHLEKHGDKTKFWNWYTHDRNILENSWVVGGFYPPPNVCIDIVKHQHFTPIVNREVVKKRLDKFEGYEDKDILVASQSFKGEWE